MFNTKVRNTLLNTTAVVALCGIASVGAQAQVQFNQLLLTNGTVMVCLNSPVDTTVNIMGSAATDGVFVSGISLDFTSSNPLVDSWNTFLQPLAGSSFGPGILATFVVPAGTAAGTYTDDLFFVSLDAIGVGAAITPFNIVVTNVACGTTPEPGNVAMLAGMGLSGLGFLARRRRK